MAPAVNLDGGFFSRAARRIFTYKKAAYRRSKKVGNSSSLEITSDDIIKSHCPSYMKPPYGARTRISTCVSVGLIEPQMFFAYYRTELNFSEKQARRFVHDLDLTRDRVMSEEGTTLYPPYIVVCHDTRYRQNSFTGITRILGLGRFGEFATFSFESLNKKLANEFRRLNQQHRDEHVFATIDDKPIFGIIRIYEPTTPGHRLLKYQLGFLSASDDTEIEMNAGHS
jgi:hypothetical protein